MPNWCECESGVEGPADRLDETQKALDEYDREQGELARLEAEGLPEPGRSYLRPDGATRRYLPVDSVCIGCGRFHNWDPCEHCDGLGIY